MPKFNIDKLRSAGLRYLVMDEARDETGKLVAGQAWAFEEMPVREGGHWRLNDKFLPKSSGYDWEHWAAMGWWHSLGRRICMPVFDVPIDLSWESEPFDIVQNGLVSESDFKIWPDFR